MKTFNIVLRQEIDKMGLSKFSFKDLYEINALAIFALLNQCAYYIYFLKSMHLLHSLRE